MKTVKEDKNSVRIISPARFNLADTLDCGQAFRWHPDGDGWTGIAHSKCLHIKEDGKDIVVSGVGQDEFDSVWRSYFDLDRDYDKIVDEISSDLRLKEICSMTGNVRLLRQDPWEALCSFIISQNNNIPRIKGIIERLCENFGDKIEGGYSFPSAERIAAVDETALAPLRCGFRAKYIIDAARKVADGQVDIDRLCDMDAEDAAGMLMTVKGVGPKVAACTLLFGCGHIECFPVDVWMKRAMAMLFEGGLPQCALPYAGIVQQYIFHYARLTKLQLP